MKIMIETVAKANLIAMFATVAASFAAPTIVHAAQEKPTMQTATPKPTKSGHAAVNGVNYYYAVYGTVSRCCSFMAAWARPRCSVPT